VVLLVGNAVFAALSLALVLRGWWWLLPFAVLSGVSGWLVGRELWGDRW
jgi:hypothetical protein